MLARKWTNGRSMMVLRRSGLAKDFTTDTGPFSSRQASYGVGERIGRRKGEVDDGDDQQYSKHCDKHQHRQQPHNLVYYIELHIFRLKPDVMLDHLDQLRYGLNILIV